MLKVSSHATYDHNYDSQVLFSSASGINGVDFVSKTNELFCDPIWYIL